jgi:hypothetical protein
MSPVVQNRTKSKLVMDPIKVSRLADEELIFLLDVARIIEVSRCGPRKQPLFVELQKEYWKRRLYRVAPQSDTTHQRPRLVHQ